LQRSSDIASLGPVEPLIDPTLRPLDVALADKLVVNTVFHRQAQRRPHSRNRGRPGRPADIILRLLVLQRLRGWTFDETEREVRASLVYRWVSHIYLGPVPDAKTLLRQSAVIGDVGVRELHERIVTLARTELTVQGRRARVDTTVVETNIHYPTDSTLLVDGIRVLTRTAHQVAAATGLAALRIRDRLRAANRRVREIGRASRGRASQGQERLQRLPPAAGARHPARCASDRAAAGADSIPDSKRGDPACGAPRLRHRPGLRAAGGAGHRASAGARIRRRHPLSGEAAQPLRTAH
jgi:hypothetical protein